MSQPIVFVDNPSKSFDDHHHQQQLYGGESSKKTGDSNKNECHQTSLKIVIENKTQDEMYRINELELTEVISNDEKVSPVCSNGIEKNTVQHADGKQDILIKPFDDHLIETKNHLMDDRRSQKLKIINHSHGMINYAFLSSHANDNISDNESDADDNVLFDENQTIRTFSKNKPNEKKSNVYPMDESDSNLATVNLSKHCHDSSLDEIKKNESKNAMFKLICGLFISIVFMFVELIGGYLSNSLAIFTDAAHLLSDIVSFVISLSVIFLAQKRPTKSMTFGYFRLEIIGVLLSVCIIWYLTGILVYLAIQRMLLNEFEIHSKSMLIVSVFGILVNFLMWLVLSDKFESICLAVFCKKRKESSLIIDDHHDHHHHYVENSSHHKHHGSYFEDHQGKHHGHGHGHGHSHMNMNVRAAILHVIGDIIQSVGVLLAAVIVHNWPNLKIADPICTLIFGVLVFITTINIMRDCFRILMEAFPANYPYDLVRQMLKEKIPEIRNVHSLHVWSLTHQRMALSVHLTVDPITALLPARNSENNDQPEAHLQQTSISTRQINRFDYIRRTAEMIIRQEMAINETTIQIETHDDSLIRDCIDCQVLQ